MQIEYTRLHDGQSEISRGLSRKDVIRCGRRFGKTTMLETIGAHRAARKGHAVGWFVPEYKLMRPTFARMRKMLAPIVTKSSKTEAFIELQTGGSVEFWTLDNEDAGRSRSYDTGIIDEASLVKVGLRDIVEQAIMPTLLDRRGRLIMAGTPKGIDPENYFYLACTDKALGWQEWHAPTRNNPTLDPIGVANLATEYPPLVYQQEYLAEFVDWSGDAFFSLDRMLVDGFPAETPPFCDTVFATVDSATKTGREHDGTAVCFWAYTVLPEPTLVLLDWDIVQIEGSLLEVWLPTVFGTLNSYATVCNARMGSTGVHIEDKASGTILLQQAIRRGLGANAIDSKLTSLGKDERAISVSGYVFRGMVKMAAPAYERTVNYKGQTLNHLRKQVMGYRVGLKDQDDALLDAFTYGVAIALGNAEGF